MKGDTEQKLKCFQLKLLGYFFSRLERRRTRHSGGLPRCSDNEDQSLSGKRRGGRRRPLPRPLEYIPDAELGLDQTINITNTTIIVQEGAPVALDALNIATAEIYNPQHHEQEQQQLEDHLQPLDIPDAFKNLPLVLPHDHPVTEEALSPVMGQPIVTSVTLESVAGSESFNAVKVEDILN